MSMRPSDIAMSLSAEAKDILQGCISAYFWRATLTGAPFELMQSRLVEHVAGHSGRGYIITPTALGRQVVSELAKFS